MPMDGFWGRWEFHSGRQPKAYLRRLRGWIDHSDPSNVHYLKIVINSNECKHHFNIGHTNHRMWSMLKWLNLSANNRLLNNNIIQMPKWSKRSSIRIHFEWKQFPLPGWLNNVICFLCSKPKILIVCSFFHRSRWLSVPSKKFRPWKPSSHNNYTNETH